MDENQSKSDVLIRIADALERLVDLQEAEAKVVAVKNKSKHENNDTFTGFWNFYRGREWHMLDTEEVYSHYVDFCNTRQMYPETKNMFTRFMKIKGYETKQKRHGGKRIRVYVNRGTKRTEV